jgi:hypothetical protein
MLLPGTGKLPETSILTSRYDEFHCAAVKLFW